MLISEFGQVWLQTTLVYLLTLLYVNVCVVGGRMVRNLSFFFFSIVRVYTFFGSFCAAHSALDLARNHAP